MKRILRKIKEDAIIQFTLSYFVILLLVFVCCTVGFQRAFSIVATNLTEENSHLLSQGADRIDELFSNLNDNGMRLASSSALKHLGRKGARGAADYYRTAQAVLSEYRQAILYCGNWSGSLFIYMNHMDRIVYDSGVYMPQVFDIYLDKWGISEEEWDWLCNDSEDLPYTYTQENGGILLAFPFCQDVRGGERLGTIFFRMEKTEVTEQIALLGKYSAYSFFLVEDGQTVVAEDLLGCVRGKEQSMQEKAFISGQKRQLIFRIASEDVKSREYILVIPEQEAMLRLKELRRFVWLLLLAAAAAGVGSAVLFSTRSGKPINQLADMLKESNDQVTAGDFHGINDTVNQMIQDQKKSQAALQKTFFHNLLKADFLSNAEMEYLAGRANLQLKGDIYYAAAIRLFPRIDVDEIDGQTVEEARELQELVRERLESAYPLPAWSYKRNTLVTLYVIEVKEEEALLEVLADLIMWLRENRHVDAYWGIGTPCDDLMNFWKSAEESVNALEHNEKEDAICMYSKISYADENWYLPYSVEEQLVQGLRAGDRKSVESALAIIREENFVRRSIGRKQFLKLNQAICDILAQQMGNEHYEEKLVPLSTWLFEKGGNQEGYFTDLKALCFEICEHSERQKSQKRSERMKDILDYMGENYGDPGMGLGMVSGYCKLSEGYLSAMFKEETGVNFGDYLEQLRIVKACELLNSGELVALVAEKTGYNSVQSFRRAFKRVKGVSPSEYRA